MKKILIRKIEIRNFKATASQVIDNIPDGGLVVSGHNGSGKSSILEAAIFCLGSSVEAGKVINQTTKAPASVSLTIEHTEGVDTYTRTLTPNLSESGKVTASTSSYVISGVPKKKTEYDICVNQLFGTKDWIYLLNPSLAMQNKSNRNLLLSVAGCPSEKDFLEGHNPDLAAKIGNTSFDDWQKQQERIVNDLGKKIQQIPGKTEELSALIQSVEEIDLSGIEDRIKAINAELSGVDQINSEKQADYEKTLKEAQSLRNEAQNLRNLAAQKVADANKAANKQIEEAEKICFEWRQTLNGFLREQDRIKAEMSEARQDQAMKEKQLADVNAEIQVIANQCREISARVPSADGQCSVCGVYCAQLQAKGIEAAIAANGQELDRTKQKGRATVAQRDKLQADLEAIAKKIDGLQSMEHEVEARINALGVAPTAPERKVVESTEESRHLEQQAADLEATAEKLIKGNRLDIMPKNQALIDEMTALQNKLTRGAAARQTQKNNDKIQQRISELREEESALITTQLQHKQHLAMLAQFNKDYANEVTGKCNDIFRNAEYSIILFSENMGNERGSVVFQPCKNGSTNLSTAESLIFGKLFIERVLSSHYGVVAPILVDNTEGIDTTEKLRSNHQVIATRVERHELTITNIE